jgi:hypothetical protein
MLQGTVHRHMSGRTANPDEPVVLADQQPIQRVVGKRVTPLRGVLPNAKARAAMSANARYLTKVPKGIFLYESHDQMIRDRERWTLDAVLARQAERG